MMARLALLPVLLGFACLLAALYGAVHNQISYTVSPAYFHEFKFLQFRTAPEFHNRLGAAGVGVAASWWMGLFIALPVYMTCLFVPGTAAFVKTYLRACVVVVSVTLAMGLGALAVGYAYMDAAHLPWFMQGRAVSDPLGFARAGQMHNFSYLGGAVGALAGVGYALISARRQRRFLL